MLLWQIVDVKVILLTFGIDHLHGFDLLFLFLIYVVWSVFVFVCNL